ncbi:putative bifunctional diguanylate cyclase/phosphodiesterase [Pseudoroseicyclus sp. CXY001]|uniref:putative bifunctional diguanylate cyclase/phosphodiesterase n=1 Tax=Pseudoroseicyclus sp. CXY001 TaxID=3242492 RepID=UPI0035717391
MRLRTARWPSWLDDGLARPRRRRRALLLCVITGIAFALLIAALLAPAGGAAVAVARVLPSVLALALPCAVALWLMDVALLRAPDRDLVTGLPGRHELLEQLSARLETPHRGGGAALLLLSLDGFSEAERTNPRAAEDEMLRRASDRLSAALRSSDVLAWLGGSSFGILPGRCNQGELPEMMALASRLQEALMRPMSLTGDDRLYLSASCGIALAGRIAPAGAEAVLQAATTALAEASRAGPGAVRSYSEAMRERVESRRGLVRAVAEALDRGDIHAWFQPQIAAGSGRLTGLEALARWQHPDRGLIPPAEFMPALKQAGMMDRLGEQMLRQALEALKRWDAMGLDVPGVSVNFSATELSDPHLTDKIAFELDRHGIAARRLVIEVLETVVAAKVDDTVMRNLSGLARLGCRIDLDDFGTGHAAITTIRRFSIQRLKIDRSFVAGIDGDPEQQAMVGAILTIADRLGLDTLAEGVETEDARTALTALGCAHLQGFGIARPMPLEDATRWIAAHAGLSGALAG